MLMMSTGIFLSATFFSNCDFIKRTCGPNNKTSTFLFAKLASASEADTAKISASNPLAAAAFSILLTNKLVLIPAAHTNMIVFSAIIHSLQIVFLLTLLYKQVSCQLFVSKTLSERAFFLIKQIHTKDKLLHSYL